MNSIRVAVTDDHPIVLAGVAGLLGSIPEMSVVAQATTATDALRLIAERLPDVAVIDLSLPDMHGVELMRRLTAACGGVLLLALTAHEDGGYVQSALAAGARGYVLKRSAADDLPRAIRAVAAGGMYLDPAIAGRAVRAAPRDDSSAAGEALSPREETVMRLTALGFSNKEIARRLDVGVKSVETYKARGCEKLRLRSRAEIVRYAAVCGWLAELQIPQT